MRPEGFIPARFSFTPAARSFIEKVRNDAENRERQPAVALSVAWGTYTNNDGEARQGVVVGLYMKSEVTDAIASWIQDVDGLGVIFNTVPDLAPNFDGKVIDYAETRWFFLRDPVQS
ncbi:MAG: hypothetical protein KGM42_10645 [Hyphomicrobiales bacterium]|nr:hypothetical protein [Hyphomicrobiales bacterium]